jgi:cytidylate kinase
MDKRPTAVVTIARQLGSGGGRIGQAVARRLGMKYADREILQEAAKFLGMEDRDLTKLEERVANAWERAAQVFLIGASEADYSPALVPLVHEEVLFKVESRIIQELAARENVVVMGRAGSHVLRDHPGLISVFVHAPIAWRVARVMHVRGMGDWAAAFEMVQNSDHGRARFVEWATGRAWTDACDYHLSVNTAVVGHDAAVDLIATLVSRRMAEQGTEPAATP